MAEDGKETFLRIAADVGKYYTFVGHALRAIYDPTSAAQLPPGVLDSQLDLLRASLLPALGTNDVVQQTFADLDGRLEALRLEASAGDKQKAAEEARQLGERLQERAKAVSDLVALFRRL